MNTIAPNLTSFTLPNKKMLWLFALATPAVMAPTWCLAMRGLPAPWGTASGFVLLLLLATSSITDVSCRKIFNWTTYSAAAWAFAINLATTLAGSSTLLGGVGIQQSLAGFAACFAVMIIAYWLARGGAGDVKLAATIGALVGVEQGLLAVAISYILAGAAILAWTIWTQGPLTLVAALGRFLGSMVLPLWISPPTQQDKVLLNKPIPLAGFFAAGTLIVVLGIL